MAERRRLPPARRGRREFLGAMEIPGLQHAREVHAWVPPGDRPLPVLYLWDGQNVFDDARAFAGAWRVGEAMERRLRRRRRPAIVVAIDHGGAERIGDYAPFPTQRFGPGRADALLAWLLGTLAPLVRQRFGALSGPEGTLVGGSSMGGLLSLYALLRHPGRIGGALAMSPSFAVGGRALWELAQARPLAPGARLYLDGGAREHPGMAEAVHRMGALLRRSPAAEVCVRIDPRGHHREASWRRRLPRALDFLLRA